MTKKGIGVRLHDQTRLGGGYFIGVEQWQLGSFISCRSQVRILSPKPCECPDGQASDSKPDNLGSIPSVRAMQAYNGLRRAYILSSRRKERTRRCPLLHGRLPMSYTYRSRRRPRSCLFPPDMMLFSGGLITRALYSFFLREAMTSTFKVGDRVRATCEPHDGSPSFEYTGKILKLVNHKFGKAAARKCALIEVAAGTKYHKRFDRRHVTVSLVNLKQA